MAVDHRLHYVTTFQNSNAVLGTAREVGQKVILIIVKICDKTQIDSLHLVIISPVIACKLVIDEQQFLD